MESMTKAAVRRIQVEERKAMPTPASAVRDIKRGADGKLVFPPAALGRLMRAFVRSANDPNEDKRCTGVLLTDVASALHYAPRNDLDVMPLNFVLDAMTSLAPRDGLEVMICGQMVALHSQAMEYLRRAVLPDQTSDGVDHNVNRATRLLRTFAILTESLRAHRSGGKQTVTVEHVTVQAGGQAIVGAVTTGGRVGDAGKIEQ